MVGIAPGAFCEARPGAVQAANRGTLFLDHVTALPEGLLKVLLRVLERHFVRRVGGTRYESVDVWIIATTYEDLRTTPDGRRRYRQAFNLHERFVEENLYQLARN